MPHTGKTLQAYFPFLACPVWVGRGNELKESNSNNMSSAGKKKDQSTLWNMTATAVANHRLQSKRCLTNTSRRFGLERWIQYTSCTYLESPPKTEKMERAKIIRHKPIVFYQAESFNPNQKNEGKEATGWGNLRWRILRQRPLHRSVPDLESGFARGNFPEEPT